MRPEELCGSLADADRLAAFAAVVLGAGTMAEVSAATGQSRRAEVLRAWYPDHATLRRYLVDEELLAREAGVYWRIGGPVWP